MKVQRFASEGGIPSGRWISGATPFTVTKTNTPSRDHALFTRASYALNEAVMGFLALVALATASGPLVFAVSAETDQWLTRIEVLILLVFIAEFIVQFANARDRKAWLRSPWRIVDVVCIIGPLFSFLPRVSDNLRGALVFRLLRVGRAVAFGARAGALAVEWVRDQKPVWYHADNVAGDRFREMASLAGTSTLDQTHFDAADGRSHITSDSRVTSLYLSLPTVPEAGFPELSRNQLLVHVSAAGVLTATAFPSDLQNTLAAATIEDFGTAPFPVRTTYRVLASLRDRYQDITRRYKDQVLGLEALRANNGGTVFLREAFRLQREIASASADLWRLMGVVDKLANGKALLPGWTPRTNHSSITSWERSERLNRVSTG
jgi:Ion transport protein